MFSSLLSQNKYTDVKIIETNSNYVILEFTPIFDTLKTINKGLEEFSILKFNDCIFSGSKNAGYPDIASRNITIGLPAVEGNSVEILSDGFETLNNINYLPSASHSRSKDSIGFNADYVKNENGYKKNSFYPENIVELMNVGIARENILGTLRIYPLQYNPVTKQLKKYSVIRVKIYFGINKTVKANTASSIAKKNNLLKNLIVNYDQSSGWTYTPQYNKITSVKNSVLNSGTWYKIEIDEDGIYKLDAAFFKNAGISLTNVDPRTLRVFGNGGGEVLEDPTVDRPNDLVECAVYASGESDGTFNDTDYFLFYGQGPNMWSYDGSAKKFRHFINHYSVSNYYFITFGGTDRGKRVSSFTSGIDPNPYKPETLPGKVFVEPEKINLLRSGKQWYGQALVSEYPSTTYLSGKLDGIISNGPVQYRVVCGAASSDQSYFKIEQNSQFLSNVYVNYPIGDDQLLQISDTTNFIAATTITDSKLNFKVTYVPNSSSDKGYFDWVEAFYKRSLTTSVDEIQFTTPDTIANVEYNLTGFSNSNILVFDVTDQNNMKLLSDGVISAGNIKFQYQSGNGKVFNLVAVGNNGLKTPAGTSKVTNSNLHGVVDGAELIVISPNDQDFLSEAQIYKAFRESSKKNPLKTIVINLDQIFNEFSSGKLDPGAIRDFIKYAFNNWTTKPKYVMLLGDGSYDPKNLYANTNPTQLNRIPVYENAESNNDISSYVTDDFYTRFIGNDLRGDIAIGRIPAITKAEVVTAIEKIISYEGSALDSWRNRLTFVADDGLTSDPAIDNGSDFTDQSESLAEYYTPQQFEKNKIYIVNYKTVVSSSGRTKPDANIDIIKAFNDGSLLINYVGHGNPEVWAHEGIMRNETTIPLLQNRDKLPFVVAATCDFGRFDDWKAQSGTELFVLKDGGGAIGVLSASRSVYANYNSEINREFITNLFTRDENSLFPKLGDVMFIIKQEYFSENDSKFHLIGDPSLRLDAPIDISEIDSINGNSAANTIQLKALEKVNMKGYVRGLSTKIKDSYNGQVQVSVHDAPKTVDITEGNGHFVFSQPGGIIYNGTCSIASGKFNMSFYIPKDISYENKNGKISMYFSNQDNDGYGYNSNIIIGGTDTAGVTDLTGPVINLYLNDRNFRSGDLVGSSPTLLVDLYDESGINTTGLGVGHRFEAFIDNSTDGITLNSYYRGKTDSYKEGTAEYKLESMSNGNHQLKVKVYDVFNNPSSGGLSFKVQDQSALSLTNVMNYPNPFKKSTKFTMQQNQDGAINVTIKVYTVAGRLIKVINDYGITSRFVQIEWDGRDEDGDEIANGVYLYKVITKTQDGKFTEEAFGKLSVLK